MICISIIQESRRLALADMLNASRQCDLLEVRLDRFGKAPEIAEMLSVKPKPVIMSCRRPRDGGLWDGSEEERLAILRQCIINKADYVEIELDVADQVRKFPPTKRVISYTNRTETPADIAEIYAQAQTKNPDVIKLTTLARTPEEAWPLVQILAHAKVPTVLVGLGKPGVMLSVLGAKIGAPWTYAALERGMEAYADEPTISDLENVYHFRAINRATRFIGVTGFGERERATVAALNAAFAHLHLPALCLPLGVGNVRLFGKVIEAVKLAGAVIDAEHRQEILQIATEREPSAARTGAADLILHRDNKWHAADTQIPATMNALEAVMGARSGSEHPLAGRIVLIAGVNDLARMTARRIEAARQRAHHRQPRPRGRPSSRPGAEVSLCAIRGDVLNAPRRPDCVRRGEAVRQIARRRGGHSPRLPQTEHDGDGPDGRASQVTPAGRGGATRLRHCLAATTVARAGGIAGASVDKQGRAAANPGGRGSVVAGGRVRTAAARFRVMSGCRRDFLL